MIAEKLSKTVVERIEAPDREVIVWDDALPGFGIRVKPSGAPGRVIRPPSPLDGEVEHFGQQREDTIALVRSVLHRNLDCLDVPATDRSYLLSPELRQYDVAKHRAIVADALGTLLRDGMPLQIIGSEIRYRGGLPHRSSVLDRVSAAHRISKHGSCLLLRLLKCQQRPMLADRQAAGDSRGAAAILDDVAPDTNY